MEKLAFLGGAQVGSTLPTWPLARLTVSADTVALSTWGKFEFSPEQVVSIEPHGTIPFLRRGVRIVHNRLDYPERIVFLCGARRLKVLGSFAKCGFLPFGKTVQRPSGIPFRWSAILAGVVLWNGIFLLTVPVFDVLPWHGGNFGFVAPASLLVLAAALERSPKLQNVLLKKDRHVGEIKHQLRLVQMVVALALLIFGLVTYLQPLLWEQAPAGGAPSRQISGTCSATQ